MIEIVTGTIIASGLMLWYSTKTSQDGFQKLFSFLGILLLALSFLQAGVLFPVQRMATQTENYSYANVTTDSSWQWQLTNKTIAYTYADIGGGQVVHDGNIALFLIFGMVLFLILVWFIIDLIGITKDNLGRLVRKKPPR